MQNLVSEPLAFIGLGAVTPLGLTVESYWEQLIAGESGVGLITRFDATSLPVQIAAEVRNFVPEDYLDHHVIKSSSLFMQLALVAAKEAIAKSCLQLDVVTSQRVGVVFASAMGGISGMVETGQQYLQSKNKKVSPHFIPAVITNMGAAHAAIMLGLKGPSLTLQTACSAGGDALLTAALLLRADFCDAVLVMGGESIVCDVAISSLSQAKALSRANDTPKTASKPFDAKRDGFVIGEGGGAVILAKESFAKKQGAPLLGELVGYANSMDAYHITAPKPEGEGVIACIKSALQLAHLQPSDIGYINAHGTATILGDIAETRALKQVFGSKVPPLSSTKGATGHLMSAGGLTEVITCLLSLQTGLLPPTINYQHPDPQCDLNYIPNTPLKQDIDFAMSNSMGFGGQNSCIIVKRYEEQHPQI